MYIYHKTCSSKLCDFLSLRAIPYSFFQLFSSSLYFPVPSILHLTSEVVTKFVALKLTSKITISCIFIFWQHTRRLTQNYSFTVGRMQGMGWGIFTILFMHKIPSAGRLARKPLLFSRFINLLSKFKGNVGAFLFNLLL